MALGRRERPPAALAAAGALALLAAALVPVAAPGTWPGLRPVLAGGGAGLLAVAVAWRLIQLRRQGGRPLLARALRQAAGTLALLAALLGAGVAAARWPLRVDTTAGGIQSLTPATRRLLETLPDGIEGAAFFTRRTAGERRLFVQLLAAYRQHAPGLQVRIVAADTEPEQARSWDIRRVPRIVLRRGEVETRFSIISEEAFSNALLRVSRDRRPVIAFTTGHGESDPDDSGRGGAREAAEVLRAHAYQVRSLNLAAPGALDTAVDVLIVSRPERPFPPSEAARVAAWLEDGGRLLLLREPGLETGLEGVVAAHGVEVADGPVVEPDASGRVAGGSAYIVLGADYGFHPITEEFNLNTFWPLVGVVEPVSDLPEGIDAAVLVRTSARAWETMPGPTGEPESPPVFEPGRDRPGPLPLATSASGSPGWRLVVLGSGRLAVNGSVGLGGNADLLAAAVDWLAGQEAALRLPPRPARLTPLTLTAAEERWIFWTSVAGVPGLVALLGLSLAWRRRLL